MKRTALIILIMVMSLFMTAPSYATTMYSDLSAWQTATAGNAATVDMTSLTEYDVTSTVDLVGGGTITFAKSLLVYMANGSWATWPNLYDGAVLYTNGETSVDGTFSTAALAFGLWMEPNPFNYYDMTMSLSDGSTLTQNVYGYAGALFFGWADWDGGATQTMTLSSVVDFAFSVSSSDKPIQTPEPATLLLLGFGLAGLATLRKKI